MSDIVVNDLVSRFVFKSDKSSIRNYEKTLGRLDKSGDKMVGGLNRKISKNFAGLGKSIDKTMGKSLGNVERRSRRLMNIKARVSISGIGRVTGQLRSASNQASSLKRNLSSITSVKNMIMGGFAGYGAAQLGGAVLDSARSNERNKMGMSNIFGATEGAKRIAELKAIEAYMPEGLDEIISSYKRLNASGFKVDAQKIKQLGDLAAYSDLTLNDVVEGMISAKRGYASMVDNVYGQQAIVKGNKLVFEAEDRNGNKIKRKVKKGDAAGILDFYLASANRDGVKGMTDAISKTLPGMESTFGSGRKKLMNAFWEGGFGDKYKQGLGMSIDKMKEWEPIAAKIGKSTAELIEKGPIFFEKVKEYAPLAAKGVAMLTAHYIGLKAMAIGAWIPTGIKMLKALRFQAILANAAAFAIPMAIGGAIAAFGYVGYKAWDYWHNGEKALTGLREKFPALADGVVYLTDQFKLIWPEIENSVWLIRDGMVGGFKILGKTAKYVFENALVPQLVDTVNFLGKAVEWIRVASDYHMPILVKTFYYWKDSIADLHDNFRNFFNYLKIEFPWLAGIVEKVSNFMTGDQSGQVGTGSGTTDFIASPSAAAKLLRTTSSIRTIKGHCYEAVYKGIENAFGKDNAIARAGKKYWDHAYQAAAPLSRDKNFREVKVTRDMLKNEEFVRSLNGGLIVYNQKAGFSPVSGHIENIDTVHNKAYFGRGAVNRNIRFLSDQKLQNMRVFVPVNPNSGPLTPQQREQMRNGPKVEIKQDLKFIINGADATQVVNKAADAQRKATDRAITSATSKYGERVTAE